MNNFFFNFSFILGLVFFTSCTKDDVDNSIVGTWELTAWNIDEAFDINNDGVSSFNLLSEIDCFSNETLIFEKDNIVSLNTTFNPELSITLLNEEVREYVFDVSCNNDGVISLATSYSVDGNFVLIGESEANIDNGKIYLVFKDRIEIHNEGLSKIIDSKDLTLVYTKKD